MKRTLICVVVGLAAFAVAAQDADPETVFGVKLLPDRDPLVAGGEARVAVVLTVDTGWHVNSNDPGDEFSLPTTLAWSMPDGWSPPDVAFPSAREVRFEFAEGPIRVWDDEVVMVGRLVVPESARGAARLRVEVTAQACNDRQCLPPTPVVAEAMVEVAAPGGEPVLVNRQLFAASMTATSVVAQDQAPSAAGRLAGLSLPLLILFAFAAGLGLNLTPCVYPLIPITISIFAREAKERSGGTFGLAVFYVLGMAVTYSSLGVAAALTGQLFGAALQHPVVVGVVVVVMLALAASMFGLWEMQPPSWALRASGGGAGYAGALVMGLVVGFVAAPCVGPFVVGLLTVVGERGDPLLGFGVFFSLALGLGLPYLLLGIFTNWIQKLPVAGGWMEGVRKVFGVLLVALAAYFAQPLLPAGTGSLLTGLVLTVGGLFLLVVERTGHEHPVVDRVMRVICTVMVVVGVNGLGGGLRPPATGAGDGGGHLAWEVYDHAGVAAAIRAGEPVVLDFYADWCAPCRELDEKTFTDPRVAEVLSRFKRFKVDQTRATDESLDAAEEYQVRGVPTVIVYQSGQERFRITGFEPPAQFLGRFE